MGMLVTDREDLQHRRGESFVSRQKHHGVQKGMINVEKEEKSEINQIFLLVSMV